MNDVEKWARKVAHESYYGWQYAVDEPVPANRIVDALSAAGLLRTDLHERALAACRALSKNSDEMGYAYLVNEYADACRHVGREALDLEAAQNDEGPWLAENESYGNNWCVFRKHPEARLQYAGTGFTEPQARAVAAALNGIWRKERASG